MIHNEKKKLKKLQVMKANSTWYENISDKQDKLHNSDNEINIEIEKQYNNIKKLKDEKNNLEKETELTNNENLKNLKSDYIKNLKKESIKGRYAKVLKPKIHNPDPNNIKSILKTKSKNNIETQDLEQNNEQKNINLFNKVTVQEFDKKNDIKELHTTQRYLAELNPSSS